MRWTVAAELRKLVHPVAIVVVLVIFAFLWADVRTTYHYARLQSPVAVSATAALKAAGDPRCVTTSAQMTEQCQQQLADSALNDHFAENGIALGRVTNALSTWPGLLRFVTHQLATGMGWILLAVLLSLHVAGEWKSRTIGATLLATGTMRRLLAAKIVSVWLSMILLALAGTTLLYLVKSTFTAAVGIPSPPLQQGDPSTWHVTALRADRQWASWPASFGVLGVACLIWLTLSIAGTSLAALLRRPFAMLIVSIAALSSALSLAHWGHRPDWTLLPAIGGLMKLSNTPFGVRDTRLWYVPGAPTFIQDVRVPTATDPAAVLLWAAVALALSVLFLLAFRLRRLVG